jgi:hypothetical protein
MAGNGKVTILVPGSNPASGTHKLARAGQRRGNEVQRLLELIEAEEPQGTLRSPL